VAAGHLLLAMFYRLVADAGGRVAFGDTDSGAVIATADGHAIMIDAAGEDGQPVAAHTVPTLRYDIVRQIAGRFASLNPYDPALIPGSILDGKAVNFDPRSGEQIELMATCISSKRYALRRPDGSFADRKESSLGMVLSPIEQQAADDRRSATKDWIDEAWRVVIAIMTDRVRRSEAASGLQPGRDECKWVLRQPWLERPVVRKLAISSPAVMRQVRALSPDPPQGKAHPYAGPARPFNFYLVTTAVRACDRRLDGTPVPASAHLTLIAPFEPDPAKWLDHCWLRLDTGEPFVPGEPDCDGIVWRFRTIREFLIAYAGHPSGEWLGVDNQPCGKGTRGILRRRPVQDAGRLLVLKEQLTWGDEPGQAFTVPEPLVVPADCPDDNRDPAQPRRAKAGRPDDTNPTAWQTIVLPAIASLGTGLCAPYLGVSPATVRDWLAGRWQPDEPHRVSRELARLVQREGLAHGIASTDALTVLEQATHEIAAMRAEVQEALAAGSARHGLRALARRLGCDHKQLTRWRTAPPASLATLRRLHHQLAALASSG
jgi:hypothetical protein